MSKPPIVPAGIVAGLLGRPGDPGRDGLPGVNAVPADTAVGTYIATEGSETQAALSAAFASSPYTKPGGPNGMPYGAPAPLSNVQITQGTGNFAIPLEFFSNTTWGVDQANNIVKSTDEGVTWTNVQASPASSLIRLMHLSDGEVLAVGTLAAYKSSGWATNPATATWTLKVTPYNTAHFQPFSLGGNGTKIILGEYSSTSSEGGIGTAVWADSRYASISLDAGNTWTRAYDSEAVNRPSASSIPANSWAATTAYAVGDQVKLAGGANGDPVSCVLQCTVAGTSGATLPTVKAIQLGTTFTDGTVTWQVTVDPSQSHVHGCEYDEYSDRFIVSEGHGVGCGLWYSTDNGATWTRPPGVISNPSVTTITGTPDGLVCGCDNAQWQGLVGVVRQPDPALESLQVTYKWRTGGSGVNGFSYQNSVQPGTGIVYVTFNSDSPDLNVAPVILAGTVYTGAKVFSWPTLPIVRSDGFRAFVFTRQDRYIGRVVANGSAWIMSATPGKPAANNTIDTGGIFGGLASDGVSMAAGTRSTTGTTLRGTAVGVLATTGSAVQDATAVGTQASAGGNQSTAVGSSANASGTNAIAVGKSSVASGSNATAVGEAVSVSGASSIGMGQLANVVGSSAVGLGTLARATGNNSTVVGTQATDGGFANVTAVGKSAAAGGANATAIGQAASASQQSTTAVGQGAGASGAAAMAIGTLSSASGSNSTAIGTQASDGAFSNVTAVGQHATAAGANVTVFGQGATGAQPSTTAIGQGAVAGAAGTGATGASATAMGTLASATGTNSTALGGQAMDGGFSNATIVGQGAQAGAANTTVVGRGAAATGASSSAVGQGASASGVSSMASGGSSVASGNNTIAVGVQASASGGSCTVVGQGASAASASSTALGQGATVPLAFGSSVALGQGVTVTATRQLAIGATHVEVLNSPSLPAAPASGSGASRIYTKDDGTGHATLGVRFPTGDLVLGTEGAAVGAVAAGTATLAAGTVTVSDTRVTANSIIQVRNKTIGGTPGAYYVSAKTAGTSFTISSTNAADTSTVAWEVRSW